MLSLVPRHRENQGTCSGLDLVESRQEEERREFRFRFRFFIHQVLQGKFLESGKHMNISKHQH